jgi:ABC-2 type transport system ATP-binding protein
MSEPVLEVADLVKTFAGKGRQVTAIDGLSARVLSGRITALAGPDGAGKTTLMRLAAGLLHPDKGTIRVLGLDCVTQAQQVQDAIGYMPQRFGLYEDLSVAENFALYADLQGVAGDQRRARFERLMSFTGLAPFTTRLAGRLSGGMKQKLGLACALVRPPRLLLLDEPSVGVDPVSRRELWSIVNTLVGEGVSVLWSTAYLDEAERCEEVLLMSEGRLLEAGPPDPISARLQGRIYTFPSAGLDKRATLPRLRRHPYVVDAMIKGSEVRLLLAHEPDPTQIAELGRDIGLPADALKPVAPSFEDAFIALLTERKATSPAGGSVDATARSASEPLAAADATAPEPKIASNDGRPVISVRGLVRRFGDFRAVDGIDFEVGQGEIFGLLGPNGAGKSTTFKMLCGLLPPSDGKALVLDIDLRRASAAARARIGYMAQKFSLYGNLSVLQNLQFFASAYGLRGRNRKDRMEHAMGELGLADYAESASGLLPLGYQRRLALACATLHGPEILFLDEPTSGVDPLVRREFWSRINAMAAAGVTILVTTHFMEEAEYCDRIGIVYRGKLIAMGSPDSLKAENGAPGQTAPPLEEAFIDLIQRHDAADPG